MAPSRRRHSPDGHLLYSDAWTLQLMNAGPTRRHATTPRGRLAVHSVHQDRRHSRRRRPQHRSPDATRSVVWDFGQKRRTRSCGVCTIPSRLHLSQLEILPNLPRSDQRSLIPRAPEPPEVLMSMEAMHDTTGKKEMVVCYMNSPLPYMIEENYGGCFFEEDDDLAQVLQDQEIVYQLIQGNGCSGSSRTHSHPSSSHSHGRALDERKPLGVSGYEVQLVVDEALARELQQMEDQLASASIDDHRITEHEFCSGRKPITSSISNGGNVSASRPPQAVMEDGIDPDNMTYEELQQLGEAIGTESKGLPEDVIALLPTSTYKIRIFSRKEKHDECVICCMAYKNRDKLIKLPCEHHYHQTCVTKWLKINKVCPVCNKEVFGSCRSY
uniref:RING-type domain-containing protein n=1 Tax=Leersia perrieri TaxID=77586 RepID=A0A0D9W8D7_9ORYZ